MTATKTFGRRQAPTASFASPPAPPHAPPPAWTPTAEAFRAEIVAEQSTASGFGQWRRSKDGREWIVWASTLASFAPGIVTFLMNAPLPLSIGLEVASFIANIWLRRQRRRRLREIVAWQEPPDAS